MPLVFLKAPQLWTDFLNVAVATFTFLSVLFVAIAAFEKKMQIIPHTQAVILISILLSATRVLVLGEPFYWHVGVYAVLIASFVLLAYMKFRLHIREVGLYLVLIITAFSTTYELLAGARLWVSITSLAVSCYLFVRLFARLLFPGITEKICLFYLFFLLISGYTVVSFVNSHQMEVATKCISDVKKASSAFLFRMSYFRNLLKSALLMDETKDAVMNPAAGEAFHHFSLLRYLYKSDVVYFMDSTGTIRVSSMPGVVGRNFGYRIYFKEAMRGKPCIYISRGAVTNIAGLFFAFPYWYRGEIKGVLVFKYSLDSVFPINVFQGDFLLLHRSGLVIEGPERFVGTCIYCNRNILEKSLQEGLLGRVRYKGETFWLKMKHVICSRKNPGECYIIVKSIIPNTEYYIAKIAPLDVITDCERDVLFIWMAINFLVAFVLVEIKNWSDLMSYDPLTMFFNRETLMLRLNELFVRSCRNGSCVHVLMIDLDRFKNINDTWGHLVGDVVLKKVAETIKECLRPYDVVGRYGGEEFLVAFESSDLESGVKVAERIRKAVESTPVKVGRKTIKVTVSIGVKSLCWDEINASCKSAMDLVRTCIKEADKALYKAKNGGRNRVVAV